VAGLGKTNI